MTRNLFELIKIQFEEFVKINSDKICMDFDRGFNPKSAQNNKHWSSAREFKNKPRKEVSETSTQPTHATKPFVLSRRPRTPRIFKIKLNVKSFFDKCNKFNAI